MSEETKTTTENKEPFHLVAVYGSLLTGLGNHRVMTRAEGELLGEDTTYADFTMISLGGFPGLFKEPQGEGTKIKIEVYKVPEKGLLGPLDSLEGYSPNFPKSSMYIRELIKTTFGDAWIYIYNSRSDKDQFKDRIVESGDWREYKSNK